jgi:hypothetical protein
MIGPPVLRTPAPRTRPSVEPSARHFERQLARRHRRSTEFHARRRTARRGRRTVSGGVRILVHVDDERVVDLRQRLRRELDVYDVSEHLDDFSGICSHGQVPFPSDSSYGFS